ncbi:PEP-CTERM sorting domain-containing protein [Nodosilinea nodulosa]|uniref:PEP-CTERM sorting domain-containing protein n=1 Tax=Nodosilinea nodulosa TaxID=416001 RepID=UPI0002FBEEE0|nr:PEP-CTERM sorting domain-containing protein [Nodosilinea nodulosa]
MKAFTILGSALVLTGLLGLITPAAMAKSDKGGGKGSSGGGQTSQPAAPLTCASGSVTSNPLAGGSSLSYSQCLTMSGNDFTSSVSADLTSFLNSTLGTDNWVSGGKYDSGQLSFLPESSGVASQDLGFSWVQTGKGAGSWSLDQAVTTPFVISLKAGNAYTAYYVDGNTNTLGGSWATFDQKDLSHASIFMVKGGLTPEEPKTSVPEPASSAALVLVGLSAVGLARKKRI